MKGVPAPLVGFARIGLVLVLGIALWKPSDELAPGANDVVIAMDDPAAVDFSDDGSAENLAQTESSSSPLVNFADAVNLDDFVETGSPVAGTRRVY